MYSTRTNKYNSIESTIGSSNSISNGNNSHNISSNSESDTTNDIHSISQNNYTGSSLGGNAYHHDEHVLFLLLMVSYDLLYC